MFTRVNIIYDVHENTFLLPKDAILTEDIESSVFIVEEKIESTPEDAENSEAKKEPGNGAEPEKSVMSLVVSKKTIKIGYINSTHVEILSGVKLGDMVVTTGLSSLKDGAKVRIVEK
jgi:multidrug efflux pump subunit AcrA (membrane-fusion protein)